jgi:hypothetical protein
MIVEYINHPQLAGAAAVACSVLLGVCFMALAVWLVWKSRRWTMEQLLRALCLMTIAGMLINVLHLVDVIRENRGERSTRQMLWQWLGLKRQTTTSPTEWHDSPRKESHDGASALRAGPSHLTTEWPQSLPEQTTSNTAAHEVSQPYSYRLTVFSGPVVLERLPYRMCVLTPNAQAQAQPPESDRDRSK